MKKQVYDYFLNLDNENLIRHNNVIIEDQAAISTYSYNSDIIHICGEDFFTKYSGDLCDTFQPIASSELFNNSGILTPPIFVTKPNGISSYSQIAQDVRLPIFSECIPAGSIGEYIDLITQPFPSEDKWEILRNPKIREYFLEFVTEDCLNQIVSAFLIDELRSECDRHINNYFLYKLPGSTKYNGIILIDHDNVGILDHVNATSFDYFLRDKYTSNSPSAKCIHASHSEGIKNIRKLLDKGLLTEKNIFSLRSALKFDLGQKVKDLGKKYKETPENTNMIYTPLSFLWEYNRQQLKNDLEL